MSDAASLAFEYEILEFSNMNLKFKLNFVNPPSVSSTTDKEVMVIQLRNFRDPDGKLIAESEDLRREVPN